MSACAVDTAEKNYDSSNAVRLSFLDVAAVAQLETVDALAEKILAGYPIGKITFEDLFYKAGEIVGRKYFPRKDVKPARVTESSKDVLKLAARHLAFEFLKMEDGDFMDCDLLIEHVENADKQHSAKVLINLARGE